MSHAEEYKLKKGEQFTQFLNKQKNLKQAEMLKTKAESTAHLNAKIEQRQAKYSGAHEASGADHSQDSEALTGKAESSSRAGRKVKGVEYYLSPGTPADNTRDKDAPAE